MKLAVRLLYGILLLAVSLKSLAGQSSEDDLKIGLANSYVPILMDHYVNGDLDSALYYTLEAKKVYQEVGYVSGVMEMMNNEGGIAFAKEEYDKFIDIQEEVYAYVLINKDEISDSTYLNVLNNTLVAKRSTGDFSKAKAIGHEALQIIPIINYENEKDRSAVKSDILEQLSFQYSFTGDYNNAIKYSNLAIRLKEESFGKSSSKLYTPYVSIAIAYSKMGNYSQAIPYYKKALNSINKNTVRVGVEKEISDAQIRMAETYINNNQIDEARKIVNILKGKEEKLKGYIKADYYYLLAFYNLNLKNPVGSDIESYLEQSNDIYFNNWINTKNDFEISRNLNLLSAQYQKSGKYDLAEKLCIAALDSLGYSEFNSDTQQILNKATIIQILEDLFKVSKLKGDDSLSSKVAKEIDALSQSLLFENSDEQNKLYWSERNLLLYNQLITHFIEVGNLEMAFNLIESNKSNLLINDLNAHMANGFAGVDTELVDKEKSLRSNIAYLQKKIISPESDEYKNIAEERLIIKQNELNALIDSIELIYPNLFQLKYKSDFSLENLQSNIQTNSVVVEFFISISSLHAIVVTKNSIELANISYSEEIKSKIENYYSSISSKTESPTNSKKICKEAYGILFSPIEELIKGRGVDNIIIVADDFLNNIPFESMIDNNGNYLGLEYNFSYEYSAKLGLLLNKRKSTSQPIDFLGYAYQSDSDKASDTRSCLDPEKVKLICSSQEIQEISKIIGRKKIDTQSSTASEIFDKASRAKVLHLATHACADPDNPDLSRIYFTNEELTSLDVQLKDINSDLVVLSACESGYGKVFKGEGTMSLSKSFFHAGAKSTLVSLWPVDDCTTSELMKYFYQNLNEGQEKNVALKNAKKTYLENTHPNTSKPYYWAGFVLIGDTAPVWPSSSFNPIYIYGLAVVGVLMLVLLFLRKKT